MNIALEKAEEYVNGKLRKIYGDAFVRGNNGMRPISWGFGVESQWLIPHLVMYISSDS